MNFLEPATSKSVPLAPREEFSVFDADGGLRDRCACYRMMARDALRRAALNGNPAQREQLFNLALGWHALAVQIEESLGVLERFKEPAC